MVSTMKASQLEKLSVADGGMHTTHDEFYQVQSDGTTIMSIKYNGGILLGADSRSSNVSTTAPTTNGHFKPLPLLTKKEQSPYQR